MGDGETTVLQFGGPNLSVRVPLLAIFKICDCYVRRPDQAERVIGNLLGSVLPDGTVDVRNSSTLFLTMNPLNREVPNPVYLTVDTTFRNGEATLKAFVSVNLSLMEQPLGAQFSGDSSGSFRCQKLSGLDEDEPLKSTISDKIPSYLEGIESTLQRLLVLIDDVYKYVDNAVGKLVAPDNKIARFLADAVSSLPKIAPAAFDKLVND